MPPPPLPALAAGRQLADALHALEGLVQGIASDGVITAVEASRLQAWIADNIGHRLRPPFDALVPLLEMAVEYGQLDAKTHRDLRWLCERFRVHAAEVSELAADQERLRGLIGGITFDGKVSAEELRVLRRWLEDRPHLEACWPYAELRALCDTVLADGVVDPDEQALLQAFFQRVVRAEGGVEGEQAPLDEAHQSTDTLTSQSAVGATAGRSFCLASSFAEPERASLASALDRAGAAVLAEMEGAVDYLVLPDHQDRAWAFTAVGRQVKRALDRQRAGEDVLVVRERDVRAAL